MFYCTRALAISETFSEDEDPDSESVLGIVPHQVSLSHVDTIHVHFCGNPNVLATVKCNE